MYSLLYYVKVVLLLFFLHTKMFFMCVFFPTTLNLYVILTITLDYKQQ